MKIQVKDLNEVKQSLAKLLTAPVPARVAYRATKFSKVIAKEIDVLETARTALVRKYGVQVGDSVTVPPANLPGFNAEFDPILAEEIDVPEIKFAVDDLANAGLTMMDFANLDRWIVEQDPTERK